MSRSLSRRQLALLGAVVAAAAGLAGLGLVAVGARQGVFGDSVEVTAGFPDAHDITPGTAVRIRGVDAGQVVAVEYPAADTPDAVVTLRMRVDAKFADRLYADATARVYATGLLGAKVVAVTPGSPAAGPLVGGKLTAVATPDLAAAAGKIGAAADEAAALIKEVRESNGTVMKLVRDDDLYRDLKGLAAESRGQVAKLDGFVADGRDTMKSIRAGTDAISRLPVIRGYVPDDPVALLNRPTHRREVHSFNAADLFEPNSAILTDAGRGHLTNESAGLKQISSDAADIVVAAVTDPADKTRAGPAAVELTRARADAAAGFLKDQGVHKIGFFTSRRKVSAVGLGAAPPPAPDPAATPDCVQVIVFSPA